MLLSYVASCLVLITFASSLTYTVRSDKPRTTFVIMSYVLNPDAGTNSFLCWMKQRCKTSSLTLQQGAPCYKTLWMLIQTLKELSVAIDSDPLARGNGRRSSVYIGNILVALRDNPNNASNKALVIPDGTPLLPSQHAVTLKSTVFPYLFPDGTGAFQHLKDSTETMAIYIKYRMQCFLTPFTLFKPYLLIMMIKTSR